MKSFAALLFASSLASAIPLQSRGAAAEPQQYLLKTQYIAGDKTKDGLYVEAYHTGAGTNDAVLVSEPPQYSAGFLNGSNWQFSLNTDYPWGFIMDSDANYAGWEHVGINIGHEDNGFFFNSDDAPGLLWTSAPGSGDPFSEDEFLNWLACDWVHGAPQLFWHSRYENFSYPSSCAEVWLIPEPVSS